jgi:hypothetical protein
MVRRFTLILLAFATAVCLAAAPKKKTSGAGSATPVHKAGRQTASAAKTHAGAKTSAGSASTAKVKYVRGRRGKLMAVAGHVPPAPSYQLHPDAARYQQIQQALADRGYFKGEVNGEWRDDSVDALRRFQADQKLDDDGHLSALTLIGLGLGPKHNDLSRPAAAITPKISNTSLPNTASPALTPPGTSTVPPGPSLPDDRADY